MVGSVQDAAAAVLAVVAKSTALEAFGSIDRAFLRVVAATAIVTLLTGSYRYPVVGGFLAGTGWLLTKGGVGVAASIQPYLRSLDDLQRSDALARWVPAFVFGVVLLGVTRVVKRPLVIPAVIGGRARAVRDRVFRGRRM